MQFIENRTFDELEIGESAELRRTLRTQDIELFAVMSVKSKPPDPTVSYSSLSVIFLLITFRSRSVAASMVMV